MGFQTKRQSHSHDKFRDFPRILLPPDSPIELFKEGLDKIDEHFSRKFIASREIMIHKSVLDDPEWVALIPLPPSDEPVFINPDGNGNYPLLFNHLHIVKKNGEYRLYRGDFEPQLILTIRFVNRQMKVGMLPFLGLSGEEIGELFGEIYRNTYGYGKVTKALIKFGQELYDRIYFKIPRDIEELIKASFERSVVTDDQGHTSLSPYPKEVEDIFMVFHTLSEDLSVRIPQLFLDDPLLSPRKLVGTATSIAASTILNLYRLPDAEGYLLTARRVGFEEAPVVISLPDDKIDLLGDAERKTEERIRTTLSRFIEGDVEIIWTNAWFTDTILFRITSHPELTSIKAVPKSLSDKLHDVGFRMIHNYRHWLISHPLFRRIEREVRV